MKIHCNAYNKYRNSEKTKRYIFLENHYVFLLFTISVIMNMKKIFKEEESTETLNFFAWITNIVWYKRIYNDVWRKRKSRIYIEKYKENKKFFIEEI